MKTYSTCVSCDELMEVIDPHENTHPGCPDAVDYVHSLTRDFLAAATEGDDARADALAGTLDRLDAGPPRLAEAAVIYAGWGWPVFPLQPNTKVPFERSRGFKDAVADAATVRKWWARCPTANIGIATGTAFDVLDVDFKHNAIAVWADLRDSPAMPACHGIAGTPSGGLHVLLLPSGDGNGARLGALDGLDYRGVGGYIVAAPSVVDHRKYHWWVKPSPMLTRPAQIRGAA